MMFKRFRKTAVAVLLSACMMLSGVLCLALPVAAAEPEKLYTSEPYDLANYAKSVYFGRMHHKSQSGKVRYFDSTVERTLASFTLPENVSEFDHATFWVSAPNFSINFANYGNLGSGDVSSGSITEEFSLLLRVNSGSSHQDYVFGTGTSPGLNNGSYVKGSLSLPGVATVDFDAPIDSVSLVFVIHLYGSITFKDSTDMSQYYSPAPTLVSGTGSFGYSLFAAGSEDPGPDVPDPYEPDPGFPVLKSGELIDPENWGVSWEAYDSEPHYYHTGVILHQTFGFYTRFHFENLLDNVGGRSTYLDGQEAYFVDANFHQRETRVYSCFSLTAEHDGYVVFKFPSVSTSFEWVNSSGGSGTGKDDFSLSTYGDFHVEYYLRVDGARHFIDTSAEGTNVVVPVRAGTFFASLELDFVIDASVYGASLLSSQYYAPKYLVILESFQADMEFYKDDVLSADGQAITDSIDSQTGAIMEGMQMQVWDITDNMQQQTDQLTNGYDSSAAGGVNDKLGGSFTDYNDAVGSAMGSAVEDANSFDIGGALDFTSGLVSGLSLIRGISNSWIAASGDLSSAIVIIYVVAFVIILAGIWRFSRK